MINDVVEEVLHELFSSLEALDTQSAAILQFLKAKGIANDEELAPYLEQAGNASSVRWRAARVRIDHLLSSVIQSAQEDAKAEQPQTSNDRPQPRGEKASEAGRGQVAAVSSEANADKKTTGHAAIDREPELKEKPQTESGGEDGRGRENVRAIQNTEHAADWQTGEDSPNKKTA
jgi:hypothetical protein